MVALGLKESDSSGIHRACRLAIDIFLAASALLLIAWALVRRINYINETFGKSIGCVDCLGYSVFVHDLAFLSMLAVLLLASFLIRRNCLYLPLRLLFLAGILVYLADIVVLEDFFTRLMIDDVKLYGTDIHLIWGHIKSTLHPDQHILVLIPLLAWAAVFIAKPPSASARGRTGLALLALPASGILAGFFMTPPTYVHDWALRNVIEANFATGVTTPYSRQFRQQLLDGPAARRAIQCRPGQDRSPDIVLLILESWSPYQSDLYSGINDWTPRLDVLARENTWFSQMHAGGFSTNEGLISLLTGLDFIAPQKSWFEVRPFETAWNTPETLPRILENTKGYFTAFLTSGNLSFSRKREWVEHLGFDYLEGHDYPGYDDVTTRLHFDAVPDAVLYDRSIDFISGLEHEAQPFFVAIENVSTHHPYIHPETGERSQEAAFRYMDATVDEFHSRLASSGFFDNGLLIIISDHRAMIPISEEERSIFGQASASLVPAIIVGGQDPGGKIDRRFHQSDLLSSLAALTTDEHCRQGPFRTMLRPDESEPRCIYHARGDNRDHIDAFCPEGNHVVKLDGDLTRIVQSGSGDAGRNAEIVQEINLLRILGQQRESRRAKVESSD